MLKQYIKNTEKYMHKTFHLYSYIFFCDIKVQNQLILTMVLMVRIIIHVGEAEITREHKSLQGGDNVLFVGLDADSVGEFTL